MPSTPMDLLLGLIGRPPTKGSTGSDEFGNLLGLFAPTPQGGNSLPVPALPFAPNPDLAVVKLTQLYLPQDLAEALGLDMQAPPVKIRDGQPPELIREEHLSPMPIRGGVLPQDLIKVGQPLPESFRQTLSADNPEPMAQARAGLLSVDDGNQQALYLKILPGDIQTDAIRLTPGKGKSEEMVLPMRLRTVEQDGNRIIADAELQTATGKDASIRLRLELAGNPNRVNENMSRPGHIPEPNTGNVPEQMPSRNAGPSLSRLLHGLNVKSLVIEQVGNDFAPAAKEIAPQVASSLRNIPGLRVNATSPTAINSDITGMRSELDITQVAPVMAGNEGTQSTGSGMARNRVNGPILDNVNGHNQTMSNVSGSSAESALNGTTTIPVTEIVTAMPQPDGNTDLSQARFYNLDHKLDQLKSNPGQKIKIQLVPARLGKMELSIASHRGLVTVNLSLDSVQARQIVEKNLAQLESHLASSGIRVDNFQLHVNQPSKGGSFAYYQQQYDRQHDGFNGHQERGSRNQPNDQRRLRQFRLSDASFEQTMVNCLA